MMYTAEAEEKAEIVSRHSAWSLHPTNSHLKYAEASNSPELFWERGTCNWIFVLLLIPAVCDPTCWGA